MKRNLILAWRQLIIKGKLSVLQIFGITLGVTTSLLLCTYVNYHYSYDRFHNDLDQIYRVTSLQQQGDAIEHNALSPSGIAPLCESQIPGVVYGSRIARWIANDVVLSHHEQVIRDNQMLFVEPSFFQIFSFRLKRGSYSSLAEPNTIFLTESKAKALFGDEDPIEGEVMFENFKPFLVKGIIEDPPVNSHLQFSCIMSLRTLQDWGFDIFQNQEMTIPYVYTYLKLDKKTNAAQVAEQITNTVSTHQAQVSSATITSFQLTPVTDLHLFADYLNDIIPTGPGKSIWILYAISLLILLISWVNHVNIFTISAVQQKKSLGIRKIIGAKPRELFQLLFSQSIVASLIGVVLGVLIAVLIRTFLFDLLDISIDSSPLSWFIWKPSLLLFLFIFSGTIIASLLPSIWVVKRNTNRLTIKPTTVVTSNSRGRLFLVGSQFAIILTLIVSSMVVYKQGQLMQQKDPGIKLDHVMSMKSPLGYDANKFDQQYQSFKDHLLSYPSIREVGFSRNIPGNSLEPTGPVTLDDKTFSFGFYRNFIEPDYLSTYEIPILARAKISLANDSRYAFVNRKVVDLLGFKDPSDILRKHLEIYGWNIEIIGVTENFHQQSLHHPIVPTIFDFTGKESASVDGYISIQYDPGQNTSMLNHWIKEAYHQFFPLTVYESIPVQESYFQQYRWDLHFQRISILFTLIALCIGCTGLWALSLLLIQQRLREVCVRKILGASIRSIVYLFAHDFLLVIILSMPFAFFLSHYVLTHWLENYAYHIDISWWIYATAGLITLGISVLTISAQSITVQRVNPIDHLRISQ